MNLKHFLLFPTLLLAALSIKAQSDTTNFKPSGKFIVTSFFDYSTGLNSASNLSGFDLTRALLGYKYKFHPQFEATVSVDGAAGRSTNDDVKVYVRNAFVRWSNSGFRIDLGLMNLKQFSVQQDFWGHRYTIKSFQDLAAMGYSVDIGLLVQYTFVPMLSVDFTVTNGEGYKKIRKDKSMKYGLGTIFKPFDFLTLRAYADIYTKDNERLIEANEDFTGSFNNQMTYSFFAGYKNELFNVGIEYNKQFHHKNIKGNNVDGTSIFSTVNLSSQWNIYARYDYYNSSTKGDRPSNWHEDRHVIIAGIEYKPFRFLRFTPNFRNFNYTSQKSEQYVFISGEFKF